MKDLQCLLPFPLDLNQIFTLLCRPTTPLHYSAFLSIISLELSISDTSVRDLALAAFQEIWSVAEVITGNPVVILSPDAI